MTRLSEKRTAKRDVEGKWADEEFRSAYSRILLSGKAFVADISGALYWPAEKTLIVSDLHFEKGASLASKGTLLPPYDTRATLSRLSDLIDQYKPQTLISLGDSLHDETATETMDEHDRETLRRLQKQVNWIWITGNHDPEIEESLGGEVHDNLVMSGITFRHEPVAAHITHEIAGHLHPVAKISQQGRVLRRRCFLSTGTRLIMPAFGAYTGGLNVLDETFSPLMSGECVFVWMIGLNGIYPVAARQLLED